MTGLLRSLRAVTPLSKTLDIGRDWAATNVSVTTYQKDMQAQSQSMVMFRCCAADVTRIIDLIRSHRNRVSLSLSVHIKPQCSPLQYASTSYKYRQPQEHLSNKRKERKLSFTLRSPGSVQHLKVRRKFLPCAVSSHCLLQDDCQNCSCPQQYKPDGSLSQHRKRLSCQRQP